VRSDDNILPFVQMLRCIKNLSEDANTLEPLQRAGAIPFLVPMLARREGPFIADMHNQVRWEEDLIVFLFVPTTSASCGTGLICNVRSAQSLKKFVSGWSRLHNSSEAIFGTQCRSDERLQCAKGHCHQVRRESGRDGNRVGHEQSF
jgi:hypothetical protein